MNGQWQLPSARPEARTVQNADRFVVNFVLRGGDGRTYDHGHVLLIDGVECAAWGHGLNGEVIGDAFWGSEKGVDAVTAATSDTLICVGVCAMRTGRSSASRDCPASSYCS